MSCKAPGLCAANSCCDSACYGPRPSCRPPRDMFSKKICEPLQRDSVYCMSYQKQCRVGRQPRATAVFNGPKTMHHPVEGDTVTHLSYTDPGGQRAPLLHPRVRDVISHSNCSRYLITTQRHDYVPKPLLHLEPLKQPELQRSFDEPMAADTVASASFLPVCSCCMPKEPKACTRRASEMLPCQRPPFASAGETIQRQSYQPVDAPAPECYPWMHKCYMFRHIPFDGNTTYRKSYLPPC